MTGNTVYGNTVYCICIKQNNISDAWSWGGGEEGGGEGGLSWSWRVLRLWFTEHCLALPLRGWRRMHLGLGTGDPNPSPISDLD